jgi:eukaryotic-like serine/threonine-protein kinase
MSSFVLTPGTKIGEDFVIERPLNSGGMGAVFVALQISTGVRRALKVMHPAIAANPSLRQRFAREARIGAAIPSDHAVQVITAGIDERAGLPFLVMELLDGEDLATAIRGRAPFQQSQLLSIFEQLCHALGCAHDLGIVHRDLKPENIFLAHSRSPDRPFIVKVLDFGIAKLIAESKAYSTEALGTPLWMAPEQTRRGGSISPRADVWPLGLIAFQCLTKRLYWRSADEEHAPLEQLLREILIDELPTAAARATEVGAQLPPRFDSWFARCVAREPTARFANAQDALAELSECLDTPARDATPSNEQVATAPMLAPPLGLRHGTSGLVFPSADVASMPAAPSRLPNMVAVSKLVAGLLAIGLGVSLLPSGREQPGDNVPSKAIERGGEKQASELNRSVPPPSKPQVPEWARHAGKLQSTTSTPAGTLSIHGYDNPTRYVVRLGSTPIIVTECCDAHLDWLGDTTYRYHGAMDVEPRLIRSFGPLKPFAQVYLMQQFMDGNACEAGGLWFLGTNENGSYAISKQIDFCLGPDPIFSKQENGIKVVLPGIPDIQLTENWLYQDGEVQQLEPTASLPAYVSSPLPPTPFDALKLVGKHPWDMFEEADLDRRLRVLLRDEYRLFKDHLAVAGPMIREGQLVLAHGCLPHACGSEMAYIAIHFTGRELHCVIHSAGQLKHFSSSGSIPWQLRARVEKTIRPPNQ